MRRRRSRRDGRRGRAWRRCCSGPITAPGEIGPEDHDRLGGDTFPGQEGGDLGGIGIDLGLDLVKVVASRGVAQRPDREIGDDEGLRQALDGDIVLGAPAAREAVADQPAGAEHAQRQQHGADEE